MKNFTNNFKQFTSRLSARWLIMALMLLLGTSSAWAANLYIYSTSSSAKAWIWVEGGSNYTGGDWNNRPALSNTTYFESLGNNIYRYKYQTLPTTVSIILTPSGGSPEARIDNLSLTSNKYLSYSGGSSISQVTPSTQSRYVAGGTAGDSGGTDNVFGTRWDAAGATNKMTWDDSKCLFVKEYITNESSSITLTFKITNGTWSSSWPSSNKTQSVSSGCRKTTITYNIFTNAVSSTSASSTECCTPSAEITEATYSCYGTTIHLEGSLTEACDGMYYGWQYKTTSGDDWSTATAIPGAASNYSTSAKTYELDWTIPNPGTTYYFRAYATPDANTWYSDGTTETVKTYKSPTLYTVSGSDATLTLSDSESGYTYTLYNNGNLVSNSATEGTGNALSWTLNDGGTYTVKAKPAEPSCDEVLMSGSYTYSPCTPANVTISNLSSTTLCTGGSLTFTYTAAAGANVTFKMGTNPSSFTVTGDGSNSGTVTITYNSNSSTSINSAIKYDVSGTDICALTGQSTGTTINCGPKPSIAATSGTSFSFCPGDAAVTLSVTADKGTYSWAKNGEVIAGKTSNSIEVSDAGTYTVFVVGTGGCESNTITFTVNGNGGPVIKSTDASFNPNNFADFAALYVTDCSGKEITGYQWYKDGVEYVSECDYTTKDGSVPGDAGKTNNIRPNAVGRYTCKVTYDGGTSATSAEFEVTATSGTTYTNFNSPIPVIMVNTGSKDFPTCPVANETASKHADEMKEKLSVDVKILHNGSIVYDRKARMAYRGSSSLNFIKKSYAFCPGDANCGDADKGADYVKTAKLNMLDIGEACDKDWVLYAAAADPSMLRNRMVFETYQAMRPGEWGVKSCYVELIINGEYKGVYLMMDKITQNKKRVNVEWDVKDETKRGFILKFDKTDVADRSKDYPDGDEKTFLSKYSGKHDIGTYDTTNDQAFEIEYPEKEDIQEDGGNWYDVIDFIQGMINNFETALSAGEYQKVQQIIDYESWADWFILSEYTKNVDAFRASCVFVYDGTKLKATPLWDQELSFNNQSVHANRTPTDGGNKGCENVNGLLIQNERVYSDGFAAPFWFTGNLAEGKGTEKLAAKTFTGALLNDPCFVQMVKNRWTAHKSGALSNASLTALITNYEKELTSAVRDREANFWNGKSRNTLSCPWPGHNTGYYDDTYADAKADITAWISDAAASGGTGRRAGLSTAIDALEGTGLDIAIKPASIETTPWVPVVIQVQNETGYEYTLTYTDGELDKQPNIIIEKSGDTYKYHIPRPAAWPAGDEQQEGERADINYSIKATLQVGEGNNQCGSTGELPSATATITLQDEPNDSEKCNNN